MNLVRAQPEAYSSSDFALTEALKSLASDVPESGMNYSANKTTRNLWLPGLFQGTNSRNYG